MTSRPSFQRFLQAGDWRVSLRPLTLLWPLNLWRAVSFLASTLSSPMEPFNPLRVPEQHFLKPIPPENCSSLYFPTISLEFFKKLARTSGYSSWQQDYDKRRVIGLFSRGNQLVTFNKLTWIWMKCVYCFLLEIRFFPSLYGDEYEGLCNRMTPVAFP